MASVSTICLFLAAFFALSLRPLMGVALEDDPCNSLPSRPRPEELEDASKHCSNEHSRLSRRSSEVSRYQCSGLRKAECTRYETREGVEHRCTVVVQSPPKLACIIGRLFQRINIRSCIAYFRFGVTMNSPPDVLQSKFDELSRVYGYGSSSKVRVLEKQGKSAAAYSIIGRRTSMEDRFVVEENVLGKNIAYFAVFDGHGGEFAADYARDHLLKNLETKIEEWSSNGTAEKTTRVSSFFNGYRSQRPIIDESEPDYGKILNDAILSTDKDLMTAQIDQEPERWSGFKSGRILPIISGTTVKMKLPIGCLPINREWTTRQGSTALVALIVGSRLFVANVGDSRGVMCDFAGRTVPLSFDHKPNLASERARIIANGGDVPYVHGAWRVNGHLALSRALGDGPDEKRLGVLIADPDILTFELCRHKPRFLVLATDGLWDVLSNGDVVAFLTPSRLREEYFGAKSLAYYAYLRGSGDNITVVVVDLRSKQWGSSVKCGNGDCSPSSRSPTSSGRGSTRGGGKKSTPRNSIKK